MAEFEPYQPITNRDQVTQKLIKVVEHGRLATDQELFEAIADVYANMAEPDLMGTRLAILRDAKQRYLVSVRFVLPQGTRKFARSSLDLLDTKVPPNGIPYGQGSYCFDQYPGGVYTSRHLLPSILRLEEQPPVNPDKRLVIAHRLLLGYRA